MPTVTRHQKGNRRYYTVEGDPRVEGMELPNVTTILNVINKPGLQGWLLKNAADNHMKAVLDVVAESSLHSKDGIMDLARERVKLYDKDRKTAADEGTRIHKVIEDYFVTGISPMDSQDRRLLSLINKWLDEMELDIVHSEIAVYHPFRHYAGTVDAIARDKYGDVTMLDFKTGKIYPEAAMQITAYSEAWMLTNEEQLSISDHIIMQINEGGLYTQKVTKPLEAFDAFTAAKVIYDAAKLDFWSL